MEDSSKKIIINLGKVKGELCTLNEHAQTLKLELDNVQSELSKIQIENDRPTMAKLLQINELKTRMQQTTISLKEADNWSTLSREMDNIIQQTNDLDVIANKLICMSKSLKILTNVPDYSERVKKLNEFKAIFIQAIQPILSTLFDCLSYSMINQKQQELKRYIQIFNDLDKIDSLKEIHQESVCHLLVLEWQKTKNLSIKDTIIDWLNSYFDQLNNTLNNQIKIIQLFIDDRKECCDILISLFIDLFNKINDDLIGHLNDFIELNKQPKQFLELINSLIQIKTLFDRLNKNLHSNLIKINPHLFDENHQSKQLFIILNTSYRVMLRKYFIIEQELMKINFNEIQNGQLTDYVTRTFQIARDFEKRCYLLTNSVYLPKFIKQIEINFNQSIDYFQQLIRTINSKIDEHQQQKTPDWNLFQTAFFYLQTIGDFMVQFDCFQQQIFNSWLDLKNRLTNFDLSVPNLSLIYLNFDDQINLNSISIESNDQLFVDCSKRLNSLCNDMLIMVFSIPICFINFHLSQIEPTFNQISHQNLNYQDNEEVFKLSLTPNEYITQIGQYLLTIPQHIEHFIMHQENISLKCVFKRFDQTKFIQINDQIIRSDDVAEFFLNVLIEKIVQLFIKKLQNLNLNDRKDQLHLIADIDYLNEVIDDLGLNQHKSLIDLVFKIKDNLSKC